MLREYKKKLILCDIYKKVPGKKSSYWGKCMVTKDVYNCMGKRALY